MVLFRDIDEGDESELVYRASLPASWESSAADRAPHFFSLVRELSPDHAVMRVVPGIGWLQAEIATQREAVSRCRWKTRRWRRRDSG
jgi:hypothetical protein